MGASDMVRVVRRIANILLAIAIPSTAFDCMNSSVIRLLQAEASCGWRKIGADL
jgi:hypothetical protein